MSSHSQFAATNTQTHTPEDVDALFSRYVAVCNRAMAENEHKVWFRQAKQLTVSLWGGKNFRTVIYERRRRNPLAEYILHLDARDRALEILPTDDHDVAFTWMAPVAYLTDVVHERPQWYIEHPLMLDLAWIRARARDEAAKRIDGHWLALAFVLGAALAVRPPRHRRRY
jgi:hypothetical protein